jgi:capsular polysaccharide transport system permease protein
VQLVIRTATSITWAVWRALFLREAITRLAAGRVAWLWILLEPIAHLFVLNILFGFILQRVMSGIPGGLFITTGLLGYFMATHTATRSKDAIGANVGLLTYRQVAPVDTVLVRAVLEAVLLIISSLFLFAILFVSGFQIIPNDVLLVVTAFVALWLVGLGLGLVLSVINELIPETKKVTKFIFQPLYFLSGIMYPVAVLPPAYQEMALLNPLVHGIEILRAGFFPQYHAVHGANLGYVLIFSMATMFLGLALHVRFSPRLVAQ